MKNDNRLHLEVNWLKGMKIDIPNNTFVSVCIGIFILLIGSGYFCEHFATLAKIFIH